MNDQQLMEIRFENIGKRLLALEKAIAARADVKEPEKPTFTPGPWTVGKTKVDEREIWIDALDSSWYGLAVTGWPDDGSIRYCRKIAEANARLIAEAPAMLAILKMISNSGDYDVSEIDSILKRVNGDA